MSLSLPGLALGFTTGLVLDVASQILRFYHRSSSGGNLPDLALCFTTGLVLDDLAGVEFEPARFGYGSCLIKCSPPFRCMQ